MAQWVYSFGTNGTDGDSSMRNLLGGKGANLAEMSGIGLPVPPGFTITTEVCTYFYDNDHSYPDTLKSDVAAAIALIEAETGTLFADPKNPLLVSVRSGARASMPGMMDTVLNLGLNDETAAGLALRADDTRFAYDSYRRFIQMYADVVMDVDHGLFEDALEDMKRARGIFDDTKLTGDDLQELVRLYKSIVEDEAGNAFPQDPWVQLWGAVGAVFTSWMNTRAKTYRRLNNIPAAWGTAVNVQAMVFGNMGDDCATGVAFTRDPSTGENTFYGEFLINAQGEDVVAGIRTPLPLTTKARLHGGGDEASMQEAMPEVFDQLDAVRTRLEAHYCDMQDLEFTVQQGRLYMLQTRSGKRTAEAAIRMAVEMADEGLISKDEAICRVDPLALDQLLHPTLDPDAQKTLLTRGLPASPGAACGQIVLSADKAEEMAANGHQVILVRLETSPEDIHGMHAAAGILTARGGMTSHAAVVARGMGRPCVSGSGDLSFDEVSGKIFILSTELSEGDILTIDGSNGNVYLGEVATIQPRMSDAFATLMGWADQARRMRVRTNAETPADARVAVDFGAEGIGLCRTEHMFFDSDRIIAMREMIMAADTDGRETALAKLLPMQRQDFESLFEIMAGLPVTIRLLDPPLHEFLPHSQDELAEVAKASGITPETARQRAIKLSESNPMLGHRGCRLAVTYPEICRMQARAVFEAACAIAKKLGTAPIPEIMVPLAATAREIALCKAEIIAAATAVMAETGQKIEYLIGTMVELPRAAICAGDLAEEAEFFSFGTNDLTQTALGISRDDAGAFLHYYAEAEIYPIDPFVSIDRDGVGALVRLGVENGKATRPDIKLGICGEHGGDPDSISFFEEVGLDYISCSPFRVPAARLAAAQAHIRQKD
ncbi:pyruvate, phosphate dikinase [Candidatus Puniceispirillum sp.]|jgi:pyruvate, orthophosphate dikinase|uniref:pyruvate, phosphate dikinase n=1 Tax=Candidatus Puniceispirillum sp. TaxID=2026719 RepID=UPI001EB79C39|nr:pyruvate, phosphate dikinase [Candidatus Puniceispirillum sp.]